jgi:putative tryptophan/tyrosine transport system substrate-binding protein
VAAWPVAAGAQQPAMPVIGFLSVTAAGEQHHWLAAFRQGLSETGYVEGQNVSIEYRWAEGQYNRLPELAGDLVRRRVSVIVTPASCPCSKMNLARLGQGQKAGRLATSRCATFVTMM